MSDSVSSVSSTPPSEKPVCDTKRVLVISSLVLIIILIIVDSFTSQVIITALESFISWLQDNIVLGAFLYALLYILCTVLFVPGLILTLGAGFAFSQALGTGIGIVVGSLVVFIAASTGALLAFIIGRYVLRDWVNELVVKYPILTAFDLAITQQGLYTVILLRLSPIIPFNAFNYIMGSTGVTLRDYALGSFGMIPGTVAYVYFGSLLSSLTDTQDVTSNNPALYWTLLTVGIIATITAVVLLSYMAKKKLNKLLEESQQSLSTATIVPAEERNSSSLLANDSLVEDLGLEPSSRAQHGSLETDLENTQKETQA